ncbi:carbamoyltransferase HypF [Shewanella metallivivens]|uniref:Carbamoyltransferase HypF n=1 Tax=Shewanella metallivivens TaxID=2872342 RepID=A0ABT5TIH4_9GAMM|nr:carbamoyltransferase HypF [Shewanella metallivivens]MDD8058405.1 carbamoyltransferase HypF [Shewanella metallivivens]
MQMTVFVKGIVQGVGFRPFVYRLATELNLFGTVLNNHLGVTIELQGPSAAIDSFINTLQSSPPPLARIDFIEQTTSCTDVRFNSFSIIDSHVLPGEHANVAISADKSVCQDCLDEINDPNNRHYHYPFTNCTNCGPRYTIINALPYDRCNTAMAAFNMCPECAVSYTDPLNRRYHAQPVSCPQCGPQLQLSILTPSFNALAQNGQLNQSDLLTQTAQLIKQGAIVAIKGLGGFHLVCDATNDDAVALLRQRKQRPAKPLAIMVKDLNQAKLCVTADQTEWDLLSSAEKPITLLTKLPVNPLGLSEHLAPGIDRLGVFLPYTPLHHLLMQRVGVPIVATSANRSGEPIIGDSAEIKRHLGHVVDAILNHNRAIINACDDSVVQVVDHQLQVIRLARGYAPLTINLDAQHSFGSSHVLAVGAQQKNAVAFGFDQNMILSPHIGDLFSLEAQQYFHQSLATFTRLYDFNASHVVHDNHPQYAPSQWAKAYQHQHALPSHQCVGIQHHYAHVLSVMAVHQHTEPVFGVSFDGTGLGDDGTLWGSEVMLANMNGFTTLAHFSEFTLIGGEQAIKQPVRILLALLFEHLSLEQVLNLPINAIQHLGAQTVANLHRLWVNNSHCIRCRSVGRLFDALAVGLNLIEHTQYEGQAGMMIETAANQYLQQRTDQGSQLNCAIYEINLSQHPAPKAQDSKVIEWHSSQFITQLVLAAHQQDFALTTARLTQQVCWQFMAEIADKIDCVAQDYRNYPQVFCGGVFQNKTLLSQCLTKSKLANHQVLASQHVPINDGGIALGQLWYGANLWAQKKH